jgi:hypothetical protein
MAIVLRRNQFTQPDYDVVYTHGDGRELGVGRIFRTNTATANGAERWVWTVEFHQRKGRKEPHQGNALTLEEAKIAWRRCWDSAAVPIAWPPSLQRPEDRRNGK